jgi:hypothetical protein
MPGDFMEQTEEYWDKILNLNLKGPIIVSHPDEIAVNPFLYQGVNLIGLTPFSSSIMFGGVRSL